MSELTPELNLVVVEDDDDTADYLTLTEGLAGSLHILDGMFNASTGHAHNGAHQGSQLGPNAFADNSIPGAKLVDGSVTAVKLAPGTIGAEAAYTGSLTVQSANYTVQIASNIMYVWCTAGITVTLTAGIQRPVTVRAISGNVTVNSTSGLVVGGSPNPVSGAIQNGIVTPPEAYTYKWDGTNWGAV